MGSVLGAILTESELESGSETLGGEDELARMMDDLVNSIDDVCETSMRANSVGVEGAS